MPVYFSSTMASGLCNATVLDLLVALGALTVDSKPSLSGSEHDISPYIEAGTRATHHKATKYTRYPGHPRRRVACDSARSQSWAL